MRLYQLVTNSVDGLVTSGLESDVVHGSPVGLYCYKLLS